MWAADYMDKHTLEAIQTALILTVFLVRDRYIQDGSSHVHEQNNRARSEAVWALMGSAIKVCTSFFGFTNRRY